MRILQVSAHDHFGGAEAIMHSLHSMHLASGYNSTLAFSEKHNPQSDGIHLDREQYGSWSMRRGIQLSHFVRRQLPPRWKAVYKKNLAIGFSQPWRMIQRLRGREDFEHPVSRRLLDLYRESHSGKMPDLVHFHTLHGDYMDWRWLPELSRQVPVYLTLHDEWMMAGHCGYTLDCKRWEIGCGECPYLDSYPAIVRDATRENFKIKKEIIERSQLSVIAPSRWLLDRFKRSPMSQKVRNVVHIPNGIDLNCFSPGDRKKARENLNLPQDTLIFLFAARGGRGNRYKDSETIQKALAFLKERNPDLPFMLVVLGEESQEIQSLGVSARFEMVKSNPRRMAMYYQASDLYLHAANAENYPTVVMESMACGTGVIATSVGGIPEQIEDQVEGRLVPQGDFKAMALAIEEWIRKEDQQNRLSDRCIQKARTQFCEKKMAKQYQLFFEEQKTVFTAG